ncbi:MAG TPA: two-component system sensor histidine kinase AtoS [Negativicutes bacterium]
MLRIWPQTLRKKMILLTLLTVMLPMLLAGYVVKQEAEEALLAEKRAKLFGIARLMDEYLGAGYDRILEERQVVGADRTTKIQTLNSILSHYTDLIARNEPGLGVGYYSRDLDAIITYGPSSEYAGTVGRSIEFSHPGRKVMETGTSLVEFGSLVRGNVMNAMIPIQREGKVIGYIWVNEFTDNVQIQIDEMAKKIYLFGGFGIIISVILMVLLTGKFVKDVETIKQGLENLQFSLTTKIAPMAGETGEIALAINQLTQSLLDARSLNENIIYSIADGIITVDNAGKITTINQAAREMTGFEPEEIIGRPYRDTFREGKGFNSMLLDTLETGANYIGLELVYPVKQGDLYISLSTSRLRDSQGMMIGAVVVFKDLTEKRQLQEQIRRADRLATLGEMMAGIAHEIRNPLTAIKGFVQYLQEVDSEEQRQEYMPVIVKEVDRVNRVINELLYFARPNPTQYQVVDISELIAKTLVLVKNKTTTHKVEFDIELGEGAYQVEADAEQICQVLLNLMINAIQAIPDKGRVIVRIWHENGERIYIEVKDNGSGIKEEELEKIFDPFFTTKPAGTGLGLAVVQRIINAHHGKIQITSDYGKGTIVLIELPVLQAREVTM